MGNDGGSIPGRKDLVKEKDKERKSENNDLMRQSQSRYCVLTKEPLKKPVVGDKLGFLYNKEALIQALLDKRIPKFFLHITSLKDVKDLNIILSQIENEETKVICPISSTEFSGLNCFYIIWKCGCVISKKATDELQMKDKCIVCGTDIDIKKDLVNLNFTKEERNQIYIKLLEEKKRVKEHKKEIQHKESNKFLQKKRENANSVTHNRIVSPKIKEEMNKKIKLI